jgi:hypothetical protein
MEKVIGGVRQRGAHGKGSRPRAYSESDERAERYRLNIFGHEQLRRARTIVVIEIAIRIHNGSQYSDSIFEF